MVVLWVSCSSGKCWFFKIQRLTGASYWPCLRWEMTYVGASIMLNLGWSREFKTRTRKCDAVKHAHLHMQHTWFNQEMLLPMGRMMKMISRRTWGKARGLIITFSQSEARIRKHSRAYRSRRLKAITNSYDWKRGTASRSKYGSRPCGQGLPVWPCLPGYLLISLGI